MADINFYITLLKVLFESCLIAFRVLSVLAYLRNILLFCYVYAKSYPSTFIYAIVSLVFNVLPMYFFHSYNLSMDICTIFHWF